MKAARVDANHGSIVRALRKLGLTVQSLAEVGDGCPDIVCGFRGKNYLFEIKDPSQPPSHRKLTPAETKFYMEWRGQVNVIHSVEEALKVVGIEV